MRHLRALATATAILAAATAAHAADAGVKAGALGGDYVGASVDAAAGLGVGAKVRVGGDANAFTLQPVAASGSRGVGAAVGLERFRLSYGGPRA